MVKIIICLLFTRLVLATPSTYYLYEEKPIKLNDMSFQRYIVPQLRAMSQEYYHLLRKLHPLNIPLIEIKLKIIEMNIDYQQFLVECRKNTVQCMTVVESLYKKSRTLDSQILKLKSNQLNFKDKGMDELAPLIKLLHSIDEIAGLVYSLNHKLEQMKITLNTSYFEFHDSSFDMNNIFHNMDLASETVLTSLLDKGILNDFNFARTTFFKNIERFVVQEKNKEYLISQLEQLNLSWNTFHMKMTKGNHQPTKEVKNIIKIMHNRWNSCLKIILRD